MTHNWDPKKYAELICVIDRSNLDIKELAKGEIERLSDGNLVGINKVLTSSGQGASDMAEIFVGAKILKLRDNDYTNIDFEEQVEINKDKQQNAFVSIVAEKTGDNFFKILPFVF